MALQCKFQPATFALCKIVCKEAKLCFLHCKLAFAVQRKRVSKKKTEHHWAFSHLELVEFQYTTCLLAEAAGIMFRRKTVALQRGRAPGVHTGEPILSAAGAAERLCARFRSGERIRWGDPPVCSSSSFTKRQRHWQLVRHVQLQTRMMQER